MSKIEIYVTRLHPSGAYECSAIIAGYRVSQVYYGYSKREAAQEFRRYLRDNNA